MKPLTILWFGGGQDSTAILYLLVYDADFRRRYVGSSKLVVIMADTGDEYPETYEHIRQVMAFCLQHDIEFYFIESWMGFHGRHWLSLDHQFARNDTIMSVAFPKSCTDNLKIKVCYAFLADYIREYYGWLAEGKAVFDIYVQRFGKLRSLIGFARGEEARCAEPLPGQKDHRPVWMRRSVRHIYPLVDSGFNRADCQQIISDYGQPIPFPSNCMMCPFQALPEILYQARFYPRQFGQWVIREQRKVDKCSTSASNLGVKGKKLLPAVLAEAEQQYGHWSDDELIEYKMSHGHCVRSKI